MKTNHDGWSHRVPLISCIAIMLCLLSATQVQAVQPRQLAQAPVLNEEEDPADMAEDDMADQDNGGAQPVTPSTQVPVTPPNGRAMTPPQAPLNQGGPAPMPWTGAPVRARPAKQPPAPPPPAPAAPAPANPAPPADDASSLRPGEMLFNFQEADIQAVVKTVSQITGRNFLMDPRVKGKITIISTRPVSKSAVYQIFLAAIKAQGFTAVTGPADILKIVPVNEAKQDAEVSSGPSLAGGEQTITHVVTVQHGSATQMVALLRPLMAPTSQLSVYPPANTLILTDYASNIQNLLRIVNILDREGAAEITIVALKHASATDIADVITRLYPKVTQAMPGMPQAPQLNLGESERVLIFPDLRTNSMLIRTDNQANLKQVRDLIERLDVPAKVGGNTRVVYLRNADAVKLADILRGLMSGERSAQAAAPAVPGRPAAAKSAEASLIQADEATNSLIISATDAVFNNLRAVIDKLDVRRAQVYIEALIAEVSIDKASQFGFQWAGGADVRGGTLGAMTNFPTTGGPGIAGAAIDPRSLAAVSGLTLAYVGKDITLSNGTTIKGLGGLARALEGQGVANILSTPNLLTLDNAEAKIIVGKTVPFLTGSFSQAGSNASTTGVVNPFQTIERQDVGLTLKIKPQISEGGSIKLKILQEVSTVESAAGLGAQDLITNKRSIDTTVIVDDGNTVVLGGLIEDNVSESTQSVPFLGRIPLLGWLFKYREQKKTKTNLMVFLRPVIVRSPEDSYRFTTSRYEYIRGLERLTGGGKTPLLDDFRPVRPPEKPAESSEGEAASEESGMLFGPQNITP